MGAISRYRKGLVQAPARKKKYGNDRVWITGELFNLVPTGGCRAKQGQKIHGHTLQVGNIRYPVGEIKFTAHTAYEEPATITVSKTGGKWYVSFSYEIPGEELSEQELFDRYRILTEHELVAIPDGVDLNTADPIVATTSGDHDFTDTQKQMARRKRGSNRRKRAAAKAARCAAYGTNLRNDFAHKISRKMVNLEAEVFVFEDLKVKNMTTRPQPKQDQNGTYRKNGARAKAGLNRKILQSCWGMVKTYSKYKATRAGKLVVSVPPHHTSQECSRCSHTHPDNRVSTPLFVCGNCGFTGSAHANAAEVIKKRGIAKLLSGERTVKEKKKTMRLRKKQQLGMDDAEVTRGEKTGSRATDHRGTLVSLNRETPTTTVLTV